MWVHWNLSWVYWPGLEVKEATKFQVFFIPWMVNCLWCSLPGVEVMRCHSSTDLTGKVVCRLAKLVSDSLPLGVQFTGNNVSEWHGGGSIWTTDDQASWVCGSLYGTLFQILHSPRVVQWVEWLIGRLACGLALGFRPEVLDPIYTS